MRCSEYLEQILKSKPRNIEKILQSASFGRREDGKSGYKYTVIPFSTVDELVRLISDGKYETIKLYGNTYNLPYHLEGG